MQFAPVVRRPFTGLEPVTVRRGRYGHGSGPTGRGRCRGAASVDVPVQGGRPDRIGPLFDGAFPDSRNAGYRDDRTLTGAAPGSGRGAAVWSTSGIVGLRSIRVCSPSSRRVADAPPRCRGLEALTPAPRTPCQQALVRRCRITAPAAAVALVLPLVLRQFVRRLPSLELHELIPDGADDPGGSPPRRPRVRE